MSVCAECHREFHNRPAEALQQGFIEIRKTRPMFLTPEENIIRLEWLSPKLSLSDDQKSLFAGVVEGANWTVPDPAFLPIGPATKAAMEEIRLEPPTHVTLIGEGTPDALTGVRVPYALGAVDVFFVQGATFSYPAVARFCERLVA